MRALVAIDLCSGCFGNLNVAEPSHQDPYIGCPSSDIENYICSAVLGVWDSLGNLSLTRACEPSYQDDAEDRIEGKEEKSFSSLRRLVTSNLVLQSTLCIASYLATALRDFCALAAI